ncbi:MAG TPA: glycosyltransferase family 2 protein [Flavitalea sp.]|nr:glycosyltransferase family 2 protein [Flavitalea sp.]
MTPAPILLFTYNRLKHTTNTIEALTKNKLAHNSELIIFSDAAKTDADEEKVNNVRQYLKTVSGFKQVSVIERDRNFGLGNNIIAGVSHVMNTAGKAIVLEDDLIVSPYFLEFMNDGLEMYEKNTDVISIHGYTYPVKTDLPETFFIKGADCLGWATWTRGWKLFEKDGTVLLNELINRNKTKEFDFNGAFPFTQMLRDQIIGKNNSWAVRWYASAFLKNMLTLYPAKSLVYHAGGDGSGTNTGFNSMLDVELSMKKIQVLPQPVVQNEQAYSEFEKFHRYTSSPGIIYRIKRKLQTIIKR